MAYLDKNTGLILPGGAPGGSGGGSGSGSGGGSGGGSADFYKCSAVYGPKKVSGFIVSGAGTAAVNGKYLPTELTTEEGTPIYKHETAEYYYLEMYGEMGICTSPTDYPGNGLYYNMYDEGWYPGSGGAEPAPTVVAGQVTVDKDIPQTWEGYKAVETYNGYIFESNVTTGLTYGDFFKPAVDQVYDSKAGLIVLVCDSREVELSTPENPTSDTFDSWVISAPQTWSGYQPYNAFNGEGTGGWSAQNYLPASIQWRNVDKKILIQRYSCNLPNGARAWSLQGSDDGSTWVDIDSAEYSELQNSVSRTCAFNRREFFYHRLYFTNAQTPVKVNSLIAYNSPERANEFN